METKFSNINPVNTRIGWIGTGVMGMPMCQHLMDHGFKVIVYNRTFSKAEILLAHGAQWAESPAIVTENSDIVFTMVGFPDDVNNVYFNDEGVFAADVSGKILIDMTTTRPELAERLYKHALNKSAHAIDAPVSGGDLGAKAGMLSIMIGGDLTVYKRILPLLEMMGGTIVYQGKAGKGQHAKMSNQILIAGNMIGVCESLLYGYRAGLDMDALIRSVSSGAAASWVMSNLGCKIIQGDFNPGFFVDHFIKDMGIALSEAEKMGIVLPGLSLVNQLYIAVRSQGYGNLGTQSLMLALAHLSHLDWEKKSE